MSAGTIFEISPPATEGLLVCNPPYGHRLGDEGTLFLFYQSLGDTLKRAFGGWTAFVFAAQGSNLKHLGLRPARRHVLYNGAIECRLVELLAPTLDMEARVAESAATRHPHNTLQYSTVHVRADTGAVHASADPFLPYFLQIPVQLRYLYTQD